MAVLAAGRAFGDTFGHVDGAASAASGASEGCIAASWEHVYVADGSSARNAKSPSASPASSGAAFIRLFARSALASGAAGGSAERDADETPLCRSVRVPLRGAVRSLACGVDRCVAAMEDGSVIEIRESALPHLRPRPLDGFEGRPVTRVYACDDHFAALTADGRLYQWGEVHGRGRLEAPELAGGSDEAPLAGAACGSRHLLLLGAAGEVGTGDTAEVAKPRLLPALAGLARRPALGRGRGLRGGGQRVVGVAAGPWHSAAVTDAGDLYTWGWGDAGMLGHGDTAVRTEPTRLSLPAAAARPARQAPRLEPGAPAGGSGSPVPSSSEEGSDGEGEEESFAAVACGARHTAALTEDGRLFVWGWNKYGQLGLGDREERHRPAPAPAPRCAALACGWWSTVCLPARPPPDADAARPASSENALRSAAASARAHPSTGACRPGPLGMPDA
eukprot:tig00021428_g21144.t1